MADKYIIPSKQGNANQSNFEISAYSSQSENCCAECGDKGTSLTVGEIDKGTSLTVAEIANWCNHSES